MSQGAMRLRLGLNSSCVYTAKDLVALTLKEQNEHNNIRIVGFT